MDERQQPDVAEAAAHRGDHAAPIGSGVGDARRFEQRECGALRGFPLGAECTAREVAEQPACFEPRRTRRRFDRGASRAAAQPRWRSASPCSRRHRSTRVLSSSPILETLTVTVRRRVRPLQVSDHRDRRRHRRARPRLEPGLPALGARRRRRRTRSRVGWGHAEYLASGNVWVVRRHEIDYLAQVTVGQQLVGETWVDPWKLRRACAAPSSFAMVVVVARAATTWAFMSIASGRPQRIPGRAARAVRVSYCLLRLTAVAVA